MKLKLKKGLDLSLAGAVADLSKVTPVVTDGFAVTQDDYHGFVPKPAVREGDHVAAGSPLLTDKNYPNVTLVSPVAGTVKAIVRGERRKILRVEVESDNSADTARFDVSAIDNRDKALDLLCTSGMLTRMRQRPYDIVPLPDRTPRDIFVTAIDKAPLSPGFGVAFGNDAATLARAVALLRLITDGKVYLSVPVDWNLGDIDGAEMVSIEGPHPCGNPGVQIANIAPVNKGETVWTLDIVTLWKIGRLLETGTVDFSTVVALTGSDVKEPQLIATTEGAKIAPLINGRIDSHGHNIRIISGNAFTGTAVDEDGYLLFPFRQITVIPDGDDVVEFMGWATMSPKKLSINRSFPGHFLHRLFKPDSRLLGGRRAMIMSGEYDKVMPLGIMPEFLLKAIIGRDIDAMEKLGIYEVAPEDFSVAEYVDTSKIPLQKIVREGLDFLRKEVE